MLRYQQALREIYVRHSALCEVELEEMSKILADHKEIEIWWCEDGTFLEIIRLEDGFLDIKSRIKYTKELFLAMVSSRTATQVTRIPDPYLGDCRDDWA